jgi:hypothetical protein
MLTPPPLLDTSRLVREHPVFCLAILGSALFLAGLAVGALFVGP